MSDFEIGYVLLCDDVRKEITGKDILIGVYTSGINVSQLPAVVNLATWLEIIPKKKGEIEIEFKAEMPGDVQPHLIRFKGQTESADHHFTIILQPAPFFIQKEGDIRISVRRPNTPKWKIVKKLRVHYQAPQMAPMSTTVSPTT